MDSFGTWLKARREGRGLSQQELADRAHVIHPESNIYQTRVSSWERGASLPDLPQVAVLNLALESTPVDEAEAEAIWRAAKLQGVPTRTAVDLSNQPTLPLEDAPLS